MAKITKPKIKAGDSPAVKYAAYAASAWEREGEDALNAIANTQHKLGSAYALAKIKAQGIKGKDASAAGAIYENLLQELSVEHSIIEGTNRRFVVHTRCCPFLKEWQQAGTEAEKLCESFGNSFVRGLCERVNPKLRYSITKMMSKGESYCEERIELLNG